MVTVSGLGTFLAMLAEDSSVEECIDRLTSLLRRRQIRGPKQCALSTAELLKRVVAHTRASEPGKLIIRVQEVGKKLIESAPRELTVGNIVRRVLGIIREEGETKDDTPGSSDVGSIPPTPGASDLTAPMSPSSMFQPKEEPLARPALFSVPTGIPDRRSIMKTSMFSIHSHPTMRGQTGSSSPVMRSGTSTPAAQQVGFLDIRAEVINQIDELIDEIASADDQISNPDKANNTNVNDALAHISPGETILTYSSSPVVQKFLLRGAAKRKFKLIQAEGYPNTHKIAHANVTGKKFEADDPLDPQTFTKTFTAQGATVMVVPDSNVFALMSRVSKVIISATAVLSNGSIVAAAGTKAVLMAARFYRVPVIVLAETYKLSPLFPYDPFDFIDYGDIQQVVPYQDREMQLGLESVKNPLTDFIPADYIDLFITDVGAVNTGFMYATIREQYHDEDIEI